MDEHHGRLKGHGTLLIKRRAGQRAMNAEKRSLVTFNFCAFTDSLVTTHCLFFPDAGLIASALPSAALFCASLWSCLIRSAMRGNSQRKLLTF